MGKHTIEMLHKMINFNLITERVKNQHIKLSKTFFKFTPYIN